MMMIEYVTLGRWPNGRRGVVGNGVRKALVAIDGILHHLSTAVSFR